MMRRTRIGLCIVSALVVVFAAGCGPITAGTLVQKGGMWLAQEAVKKGYEKYKEDHEARDAHDGTSDRHGYTSEHSAKSRSRHRGDDHRD